MKKWNRILAAVLTLSLTAGLTACGGSTSTTEPVWQAELPNTGITVQVSGCTLEEKAASYWANPGAAGEPQSIMELYATDSAPLLEIAAPKAQVDIQFVQPVLTVQKVFVANVWPAACRWILLANFGSREVHHFAGLSTWAGFSKPRVL